MMNSTLSDWDIKIRNSFDRLHQSDVLLFPNTNTQDILIIIGILTVCLLLLILIIQFILKIRHMYRITEPKESYKKSSKNQSKYISYQKLLDTDNHQCKCFHSSCLPKFQCIKPATYQISPYYEQINERQKHNSIYQISSSCIRVHIVK